MTTRNKPPAAFGGYVYGLGVMALGVIGLIWGDFLLGQPVAKAFPARHFLAYAAGAWLLVAGGAVEWHRTRAWGAGALAAYYALVVVVLMDGRLLLTHYAAYGTYSGIAEQLAIAAGGTILYAACARIDAVAAARLTRLSQGVFGVCALLFGGAHFVYLGMTAPLVPRWLPPSQTFWAWATGLGFIAAGAAILTGVRARLATILLTAMLASFGVLVHWPMLVADSRSLMNWTEAATNLVLVGVAWVVADSLALRIDDGFGRAAAV